MKTSHPNRGAFHCRTETDALEKAFSDSWEKNCDVRPWLNGGSDTLECIAGRAITEGERYVAASVIQWLGTAVGFSWLCSTLLKAGIVIRGQCPSLPWRWVSPDPMLESMMDIQNKDKYRREIEGRAAWAAQLLFDLSEPT